MERVGQTGFWLLACVAFAGCMSDPSNNVGFNEPDPQARVRAAMQASESHDPAAIPQLISMLDSDDAAERFFAIRALQDFSGGEAFGYRHYDDRADRRAAIDRWKVWESNRTPNE